MAASSGPPRGQTTSSVKEGAKHSQSLSCLLSYLVDDVPPRSAVYQGSLKTPVCFDTLYWLSEILDWSGLVDVSRSLSKDHRGAV
jgi:hypothetical protein